MIRYWISLLLLCILSSFFFFQMPQNGQAIQSLDPTCINKNKDDLFSLFEGDPAECTDSKISSGSLNTLDLQKNDVNLFSVIDNNRNREKTWYNNDVLLYTRNNEWVKCLAIAAPNLKLLYTNQSGIIVLGGSLRLNGAEAIWALKASNSNSRPDIIKLADLVAGDDADKDFINYLSKTDSNRKTFFANSRLPDLLNKWVANPSIFSPTILAMYPATCLTINNIHQFRNYCVDNTDNPESLFSPVDQQKKQPFCITQFYKEPLTTFKPFYMLVENKDSYEVWDIHTNITPAEDYKVYKTKTDPRYFAWLSIICNSNCRIIETVPRNGIEYTVIGCDDRIECLGKDSLVGFVKLVQREKQEEYISAVKTDYNNSDVKKLINHWINNPGNRYIVIGYGDPEKYHINERQEAILDNLKQMIAPAKPAHLRLLVQEVPDTTKFYIWEDGNLSPLPHPWYNRTIHAYRNPWLVLLAIADPQAKVLSKQDGFLPIILSNPTSHLRAWKIGPAAALQEYAPLKNLYWKGTGANPVTQMLTQLIVERSRLNPALSANIRNHFNGTRSAILQVFPSGVSWSNSPLTTLGISGPLNIPDQLKTALSNNRNDRDNLQFLTKDLDGSIHAGGSIISADSKLATALQKLEDPWLAWLALADPTLELVAYNNTEGSKYLNLCFVNGKDEKNHLWGWRQDPNDPTHFPREKILIDGSQKFLLTGIIQKSYLSVLAESASEAERNFFLARTDKPESFELLDMLEYDNEPKRILLWRNKNNPVQALYRVGDNIDTLVVQLHLAEGAWDHQWTVLSERYRKDWCRNSFKTHIGRSRENGLEAWFGPERLGLALGDQLGVFQSPLPGKRNFGFANYSNILELIDAAVFKPLKENPGKKPDKEVFMQSCAGEKWDRHVWRANPLGYFDRVPVTN